MAVAELQDSGTRQRIQQLADDLSWLERHALRHPDRAPQAGRLRLAAALARNCLGPFLEDHSPAPLHVVVVGGAGAGKSTIANFLTGAAVAETNPQAGFTRHPIAYTSANGPLSWSQYHGFLGPLKRLFDARPSSLDDDVYQVRRIEPPPLSPPSEGGDRGGSALGSFVVWDCPDMTTWQATGYVSRLIEIVALADLVIYVASDERYNDEVPTQYLRLILQAGKPVIACLMKMREHQVHAITEHFRKEVVAPIPECVHVAALLAVPNLSPEELADPSGRAARYRQPLLDKVNWWGERPGETRRSAVRGAVTFLQSQQESLLAVAKEDLAALQTWRQLVQLGRSEFESRYSREYLSGEQFPRFNEALVRLLQLLELPGIGQYVSKTLWVLRTPWRLAKGLVTKMSARPQPARIPEEPALTTALTGWLEMLRKEAARRRAAHSLWPHIEKGFEGGLADQAQQQFQRRLSDFQLGQMQEVEATARAIYEDLEKSPIALNTLRTGKLALEVGAIATTLVAGAIGLHDIILVPLVASLSQELVELLGSQYVDVQREKARQRQQELLIRCLANPLADWLIQWPTSGGSDYERLQLVLRRIPDGIRDVCAAVRRRLEEQTT